MEKTDVSRKQKQQPSGVSAAAAAAAAQKEIPWNLVGRVVEKGFSTKSQQQQKAGPSSLPKPTVLPFPVARHRSHGPHWAPLGSEMDCDDDVEDKYDNDFHPIAVFARPIQRKKKKGLNFSKWRELIAEDCHPVNQKMKMENSVLVVESGERMGGREANDNAQQEINTDQPGINAFSHNEVNKELHSNSNVDLVKSTDAMEIDSGAVDSILISGLEQGSLPVQGFPKDDGMVSHNAVCNKFQDSEQGSLSFMSDIDAENHVRMQNMSPEEIAQAQAEIMEKMSPGIVEMLKKRGCDKLGRRSVMPDLDTGRHSTSSCDRTHLDQHSGVAPPFEGTATSGSSMVETTPTKYTCNGPDTGRESSGVSISSSWNLWTERVEKTKALRFSLDGSVVASDSVHAPAMSGFSDCNPYTVKNVSERDFLRTEGDPGAAGYTIKEAIALTRSMIPGQRALALHLLASVLDKALYNLQKSDVGCNITDANNIDWQAVWAFSLGPEPELVLSLRMSLDDNHISVVLACAKVIQCILSCDMNESFFNVSEKLTTYEKEKDICTAPVFRSKQEINDGFLNGGFWKFSTKPSNILPFSNETMVDENDGNHTIQDDNVVAGQDAAAGLIRMGILPRICYLLETDPVVALEDCLVTILIGLSRHSSACADAVMKCPRLIQTVVNRFTRKDTVEVHSSLVKSVILLKVLAQSDKKNCEYFIEHGIFQDTMWHFYRHAYSIHHWIKSGNCKLTSSLMVEQLRFWRVCIRYGYCISNFTDFFPGMCLWLSPPTFDKLIESNVLVEYASITREAYATLEALAKRLPYLHAEEELKKQFTEFSDDDMESWSWSHVVPMVELAIKWIDLKNNPSLSSIFCQQKAATNHVIQDSYLSCLLWVMSAVMHMFCSIFERIAPEDTNSLCESHSHVPWLPEFVPRIGLEIVKNGWLNFSDASYMEQEGFPTGGQSIVQELCRLRYQNDFEASLASVCCLHGLVRLLVLADKFIQIAKSENTTPYSQGLLTEDKIVEDGLVMWSQDELKSVLIIFMNLVSSEWHAVQSIEMFGRGGPAPGIGLGWGAFGGGLWSRNVLLAQMDARLAVCLLEIFPIVIEKDLPVDEQMNFSLQRINSALGACLVAGPRDKVVLEKALDILLQEPVLKYLDSCAHHFLCHNTGFRSFRWEYKEEDFLRFSKVLNSHFRNRWLAMKTKSSIKRIKEASNKSNLGQKKCEKGETLGTIHEDLDVSETTDHDSSSLVIEWAHQRLPLPMHWFLSPISSMGYDEAARDFLSSTQDHMCSPIDVLDVVKSGLFLLMGLEAIFSFECSDVSHSPVLSIPLVWKLHALSIVLFVKVDVLEDEKSRDIYETLQELYGKLIDQSRCQWVKHLQGKDENLLPEIGKKGCVEFLKFKTDIHEGYTTFVETLIEQFSAISYGDEIYGRQVALYLHRSVEVPVRLAAWNALSSAHVLELLPSIEKCFTEAEGYLEPVEDNEGILEAYVKSWISGCLDRAAGRGSMSFRLALHHLSSFVFETKADYKLSLRKKLARFLLRDYSHKHQREGMMMSFIRYKLSISEESEVKDVSLPLTSKITRRFELLSEACEGNSSLLIVVERLKSSK